MKGWMAIVAVGVFAAVGLGEDGSQTKVSSAAGWPQFRGPGGSGVADDQKPPVEFGPDKNVKWKVPVPSGLSSPVVAGDKLVLTAFDGPGQGRGRSPIARGGREGLPRFF